MTFGEMLRARRIACGIMSAAQLDIRCQLLTEAPPGESRIKSIENGANPEVAEVTLFAAVLHQTDDAERRAFLELGTYAATYETRLSPMRATLKQLLHEIASNVAGRVPPRDHKMLELRAHLNEILEDRAGALLVETASEELMSGPSLSLDGAGIDEKLLDVTVGNQGATRARDIVVLIPGVPPKRATEVLVPSGTVEIASRPGTFEHASSLIAQYADAASNVYLQRLRDPESRVPIRVRIAERPRTWWDVNRLIVKTLERRWFKYDISGQDATVQIVADPHATVVMQQTTPSEAYARHGFRAYRPDGMNEKDVPEVAFMSPQLNERLWSGAVVHATLDDGARVAVEEVMQQRADLLTDVLKSKYATLGDEQRFFNERKLCLASDLITGSESLSVFEGTYFHGFLTNELATKRLRTREARPRTRFDGTLDGTFFRGTELAPIADSGASNHIGASVLLVTGDARLQFWYQSGGEQNVGKDTATGSGSCDWEDWEDLAHPTLTDAARRAMLRELREESGLNGKSLRMHDIVCRLLGYFRWVRRGGKPEFVGLAKTELPSSRLFPDASEVYELSDRAYYIDASNPSNLAAGIDEVLARPATLSLPLWIALTCLRSRCDSADLRAFLWPKAGGLAV